MHLGPWHCDVQAQQVHTTVVKACVGWDMAAFDHWLFSSATWRNFPKVRQRLLDQRMQLERDCSNPGLPAEHLRERLLAHFTEFKRWVGQCKNCTDEVKNSFAVPGLKVHHASTKLSAVEIARIQRQWLHLLSTGQKYGALTLLAKQYGVSSATIKKVLQLVV
jgi:hypothetical protein